MTISRVSRYYDGDLSQIKNKNNDFTISVLRNFPTEKEVTYREYTWVYGESLGNLAHIFIGDPQYWWEILEINPEITDPFSIEPGTRIKVPSKEHIVS